MAFSKSFPRTVDGSNYPKWEEVFLSAEEENMICRAAKDENILLMKRCIDDAKAIFAEKELKDFQSDIIACAVALFEKRASHVVYHKEEMAKSKFDGQPV